MNIGIIREALDVGKKSKACAVHTRQALQLSLNYEASALSFLHAFSRNPLFLYPLDILHPYNLWSFSTAPLPFIPITINNWPVCESLKGLKQGA
jgi:hypothetical protein